MQVIKKKNICDQRCHVFKKFYEKIWKYKYNKHKKYGCQSKEISKINGDLLSSRVATYLKIVKHLNW